MSNGTSEKLKKHKKQIMHRWLERAQREIPETLQHDELALNNSLEEFLDRVAEALRLKVAKTKDEFQFDRDQLTQFAQGHGESRAGLKNYTIESLIFEFHILRQTICDVLAEEGGLGAEDREIITSTIEQAVNDAAARYSNTLRAIRERLTATLVHDLRNPIAAAKMGAQMIERKPTEPAYCANNASRIVQNLDRVSSLIEDVLDASRLGAGEELSMAFEKCDLEQLLQHIVSEFRLSDPGRIELAVEGGVSGYWNARALQRILENLVTNALKYGAPNEPVTLTARESGKKVVLSVHNRGPAICVKERDLLFQQYRRTKSAESKAGWGLGLVVVKGLAEAHGGTVEVESTEESGTSFIVTLPRDSRIGSKNSPTREAV